MPKKKERLQEAAKKAVDALVEEVIEERVSGENRVPGKVVHGTKTPWTRADMDKAYGICEFTPDETIPVTVNGQMYQLIAGVGMIAPTIIRDTYLEHIRRNRRVGQGLEQRGVTKESYGGALS